jgi:Fe-Mn family superoxide dismutase
MAHKLPDLPYAQDALEPNIDAQTMGIHHDKHHQAYVNKLNAALESHADQQGKTVFELLVGFDGLPDGLKPGVQKHGGGHANHSIFWTIMGADGGGEPSGDLADAINGAFGSFDDFKGAFKKAAGGVFGSGWAWLVVDGDGNLKITTTANQDNPVFTEGSMPVLGVDVWEHAYYLKYQNRRPDYLEAFFSAINWDQVAANLALAQGAGSLSDWAAAAKDNLEGIYGSLMD